MIFSCVVLFLQIWTCQKGDPPGEVSFDQSHFLWVDSSWLDLWELYFSWVTFSSVGSTRFWICYVKELESAMQHTATRCSTRKHTAADFWQFLPADSWLYVRCRSDWRHAHSCVWHDSFACLICDLIVCVTRLWLWHDSLIRATRLIYMFNVTRLYVWHYLFVCVTWLIHVWHDSSARLHSDWYCNTLRRTATQCNAVQYTTAHCNLLLRVLTSWFVALRMVRFWLVSFGLAAPFSFDCVMTHDSSAVTHDLWLMPWLYVLNMLRLVCGMSHIRRE